MTTGKWILLAALAVGMLPRLAAADYWRYETDSGSTAFTDDVKNIPQKYRASAVRIPAEPLSGYKRLSIVDPVRPAPTPARVESYAAEDEALPQPVASAARARRSSDQVSVDLEGVRIDVDPDQDEPISIDKRQYMDADGNFIMHGDYMVPTTIVRRGDKALVYIDER